MFDFSGLSNAVIEGDSDQVQAKVNAAISAKVDPLVIINQGLIGGMNVVGQRFKVNDMFVPEVLMSARAMNDGIELVKPLLAGGEMTNRGTVIIGTVKGDLHDIGKIVLDNDVLATDSMNEDGSGSIRQHAVVGYRILNLFDETLDLAEYVYGHHERWDGTGYPRGLSGEQIPLLSRIISIVETYDRVLYRGECPLKERKLTAREIIGKGSGTQFDPQIVQIFLQLTDKAEEDEGADSTGFSSE